MGELSEGIPTNWNEEADSWPPSPGDDLCGWCGHPRAWHIYHEGPCRGGFICASACDEFTEPPVEGDNDG
jgi:hypothetical protein